jgi:hypothetical protein
MRAVLLVPLLLFGAAAVPAHAKAKRAPPPKTTGESSVQVKYVEAFSRLDFVLPDGRMTTSLGARRGPSAISLTTLYNFPRGVIDYTGRIETAVRPWQVGLSGYHRVDFEQVLDQRKFIGRVKGVSVDFTRGLGRRWSTQLVVARQDNELIRLDGLGGPPDFGRQSVRQNTLTVYLTKDNRDSAEDPTRGFWHQTAATQSARLFGGDFEYNRVHWAYANHFGWSFWRQALFLRAGSPVYKFDYPVFEHFFLGGWDALRGYPLYHLEGEKMVFARKEWTVPVASFGGRVWKVHPKRVELVLSCDGGFAGNRDGDFVRADAYKLSVAGGLAFKLSFRDKIPVSFLVAYAKALEHRDGVLYFRYRIR